MLNHIAEMNGPWKGWGLTDKSRTWNLDERREGGGKWSLADGHEHGTPAAGKQRRRRMGRGDLLT